MNFKEMFLGSTVVVGICSLIYYFSYEKDKEKVDREIEKGVVVRILNELRKEFLRLDFDFLASTQLNEIEKGSNFDITDQFNRNLKNSQKKVLKKFNVTKETWRFACEVKYKDDNEIKALFLNIKNEMDCAKRGDSPINPALIPLFLTPELTLQILGELSDLKALEKYSSRENECENSDIFEVDENIKRKLFANYGLTVCRYPPEILLIASIYRENNDNYFNRQYREILNKQNVNPSQNEIKEFREKYSWLLK
ncbi:unnamed protein product [Blepharisma stoltei]|uniref:Uncharacterized protein n=1 Tax=Blepharisma stoltei TaxID=1481888 RepID=A0AAU9JXH1_9CILI|nr:unnamed protein product [Blepharisma stoltei]